MLLNSFTAMKHFMENYPAAVSELKQIAGCDGIMMDHIRNGPSADWIPLNSQCDEWDNDRFWKLMNEALSLSSEPATPVPDAKEIRGLLQELGLEKAKRPLLHRGRKMIILLHNRRKGLLPYLRLSILRQTGPRHVR
ncbi:hypothetical protein KXW80_001646 [Aspergillus fumigatus]|nr:hypothetical protein KXW92_002835 [Aspergillus fumigatus]KAH3141222.1 hypothetical protein KXW80_001646 [Aspergillus fumigatus]